MTTQFKQLDERGAQICGLLDGKAVSSFRLRLPKLSDAKLQRALPHIMSDYVSGDSSDLTFCHIPLANDPYSLVLACDRKVLDDAMRAAQAESYELHAIWPDYMQIAIPGDGVACQEIAEDLLVRRADGTGFRLPKLLADAAIGDATRHPATTDTLPHGAGFATGRFGSKLPVGALLAQAKRPLILAGLAMGLWLTATLFAGFDAARKSDALARMGEDAFREKFPEVRRIVNIEAQIRNRLGGGSGGGGFSGLATQTMVTLQSTPDIRMEAMAFIGGRNSGLDITLSARSFSALENARQKLSTVGFRVTEGKSEQSKNLVIGRFTLTPNGGRR